MKLYLINLLKSIKAASYNAHALILSQMEGLLRIPSFQKGMSKERGTKMWIKESTSAYLSSKSKLLHVRKSKLNSITNAVRDNRLSEFGKFAKIVSWIIGNKALYKYFHIYLLRVEQMLIRNGPTHTFKYMKECLRLTVRALAGSPELSNVQFGPIRVRRDSFGIPTILPISLRLMLHAFILNFDEPAFAGGEGDSEWELHDPISYGIQYPVVQKWNQRNIVGVLTLMSIFRVFATKVEPTLATITAPFNGEVKTFNSELIHKALCLINIKVISKTTFHPVEGLKTTKTIVKGETPSLSIGKFHPHISSKAGPNGNFSTWGASLDALAFLHEPNKLISLTRWMYIQKAYGWIVLLYLILIVFGPIYGLSYGLQRADWFISGILARHTHKSVYYFVINNLIYRLVFRNKFLQIHIGGLEHGRTKLYLGKLAVVYDQAGKARVVASANWWIQSAFYGLHKSIFKFLKTLRKDGTMDQNAAYDNFIANCDKSQNMSGFDLSAATDRLPINIQTVVLDCCGVNGSLWAELMNVTYCAPFDNKENLGEVEYAVGQPMGAYSSWAMLALTHHMIVNLASILSGKDNDDINYAVLGDDVVINNDTVAEKYVELMSDLGLEISYGKSVISKRFTEFAKKLRGPGVDLSPIGAGSVLAASRSGFMIPQLFLASVGNVITSPEEILNRLKDFPSAIVSQQQAVGYLTIVLWQLFGPSSPLVKSNPVNFGRLVSDMLEFVPGLPKGGVIFEHVKDSMMILFGRELRSQIALSYVPLKFFIMNSLIMVTSNSPFMRVLETLMKPFNPGFWIYLDFAIKAPFKLSGLWDDVFGSFPPDSDQGGGSYFRAKEIMRIVSQNTPSLSELTLDLSKKDIVVRAKYLKDLRADMNSRYDLSMQAHWPRGLHTRWYELEGYIPRE
uniref:RNA-dependent RNA polymerase n=1 Tax=Rhizoctonia solani mitovirus 11 TaxID=1708332 RepID=A0A0M4LD17_9VIRU|nr:RNA-dependent RNA polymerase [Rhizoctonia solani mitovirus 11]